MSQLSVRLRAPHSIFGSLLSLVGSVRKYIAGGGPLSSRVEVDDSCVQGWNARIPCANKVPPSVSLGTLMWTQGGNSCDAFVGSWRC